MLLLLNELIQFIIKMKVLKYLRTISLQTCNIQKCNASYHLILTSPIFTDKVWHGFGLLIPNEDVNSETTFSDNTLPYLFIYYYFEYTLTMDNNVNGDEVNYVLGSEPLFIQNNCIHIDSTIDKFCLEWKPRVLLDKLSLTRLLKQSKLLEIDSIK